MVFMEIKTAANHTDFQKHTFQPPSTGAYTWWSYMGGARAKNVGWRIDYFCTSKSFADRLVSAGIHPDVMGSDHCPIELVIK